MAFDTKQNLNSCKFEQFAGEILNLSGCTQIFGQFDIESGATLSICNNFGQGKVLISDNQGNATWGFTVTGYTNGLCKYDNQNVCLGGVLNNHTTIDIDTYDFKICSTENPNRSIYLDQQNNELKLCWSDAANTCCSSISINPTGVELGSYYDGGGCSAGISIVHDDNKIIFSSASSGRTCHDENGLWYLGNYSASASDRWLTDKAYVDNKVIVTGVTNGLTLSSKVVALGTPSDIENTSVSVSSGTTHNHKFKSDTFITGTGGILVDGAGRFYIDDSYVTEATLPNLYTITGITSNQSIGVLASGQTLGMVYIHNLGSTTSHVNLGTTPTGDDITPYRTITIPAGEDISVTVNMRLSLTLNKTIYISSADWTNVELDVQWANVTYQNASTTITPSDLPMASDITLGAIKIGDGISIDGEGIVSVDQIALDDLSNVNVPTPSNADVLTYNGSQWISTGLTLTTDLSSLTDVTLTSPQSSQILRYNGSQWINTGLTLTTSLSGLTDVTITTPSIGQSLVYNGTKWVNTGATSGGFLGVVTRTSVEPTDLKQNQWVKPKPEASGNYSYTFTNFCDSLGSPIVVNLSLEDVYLRYCQSGDYWTKEYYDRPLASGKTWIGNATSAVCEIPVIDEWVSADTALSYIGQKYSYPTQTIMKTDLDTCITMPNYILIQNINLKNVGNTAIFTIPTGKVAVINSLKLITLQNASPTTFKVSVGNNSSGSAYSNISACYTIADVLQYETYCLPMSDTPGKAVSASSGSIVYFRVATGSTSANELCAHLLVEAFLF
jgi:hypothetical protein